MTKKKTDQVFQGFRGRLLASAIAGAMVIGGLGAFAMTQPGSPKAQPQQHAPQKPQPAPLAVAPHPSTPRMIENGAPFSFADLVERVSPAVVTITVEEQVKQQVGLDPDQIPEPFRDFFNQFGGQGRQFNAPRKAIAMGSGFVINKDGFIVTNNHVVQDGKKITVKFPDGREFNAKLVGTDPATDIALLKVKANGPLPSVEFGDDRQVRVGDWVIAVGNPFGLSNTVTAGIVSSIGRDVGNGPYTDFIQIDAPINRGNSGGPTFNIQGRVIGMNSMIFSPSGGSVGIGFAIPATTIHDVVAQLQAHGRVSRGYLGVEIQSITPEMAASMGNKTMKGAIVASVSPGGPAAQAGMVAGDIVLAVNGKPVEDSRDLTRRVAGLPAGGNAAFTVVHDGATKTLTVKIGAKKDTQVAANNPRQDNNRAPATAEAMGLGLAAVTPETRRAFNLDGNVNGVVVTKVDPNSDAADKGLEPGDVLVSVANRPVHSPQDVKASIAAAQAAHRDTVLVLVTGQGGQRFVAIKLGA
ncbi:MAG TPA: DegQ family serine endoprotease [Rhizomicrobium sp.]|nr:DegQ family serine endoprotease [Rhizomicrobium sp.]